MCEYCNKKIRNKKMRNVDNDEESWQEIIEQPVHGHMLYIELDATDNDGYKACGFFEIKYCPMCR